MKNNQLMALSKNELQEGLKSASAQLNSLSYAHKVSPLENPSQVKSLRRQIARYKTELHMRSLVEASDKVKGTDVGIALRTVVKEIAQGNNPLKLRKLRAAVAKNKRAQL